MYYMKMDGTVLTYGEDATGTNDKSVDLLPVPEETNNSSVLPGTSMPCSRSFCFEIQFSVPMAASQNWNECVYLVDEEGNALPLYFSLDSERKAP